MAKLTYQKRKRMRATSFALEEERKYPIHDIEHGRNALARVAQHGTRAEQKEVKREVYAKYPSLSPNNPGIVGPLTEAVGNFNKGAMVQFKPDGIMYEVVSKSKARVTLKDGEGNQSSIPISQQVYPLEPTATLKVKVSKPKGADIIMGEVILYGGLPMTRANVYRQALKDTGSEKAADMFAFSSHIKPAPEGTRPFSLAQFRKVTKMPSRSSVRITPKRPRIS